MNAYDEGYAAKAQEVAPILAALERELAEARQGELEAMNLLEGTDKRWYEAQSDLKQATKDRDHEHAKLMDTARDLAAEREEARKWEWVAFNSGCGTCAGHESIGVRNILARYQPADEGEEVPHVD